MKKGHGVDFFATQPAAQNVHIHRLLTNAELGKYAVKHFSRAGKPGHFPQMSSGHDDGRDVERVFGRKVSQPNDVGAGQIGDKGRVAQLDGREQGLIQAKEHGHLDKNGHTAAGRIDPVGLVERHGRCG